MTDSSLEQSVRGLGAEAAVVMAAGEARVCWDGGHVDVSETRPLALARSPTAALGCLGLPPYKAGALHQLRSGAGFRLPGQGWPTAAVRGLRREDSGPCLAGRGGAWQGINDVGLGGVGGGGLRARTLQALPFLASSK